MSKSVYSIKEFCDFYTISRTTFYREVDAGRIRPRKCGRRIIITQRDAQRWLRQLPKQPITKREALHLKSYLIRFFSWWK